MRNLIVFTLAACAVMLICGQPQGGVVDESARVQGLARFGEQGFREAIIGNNVQVDNAPMMLARRRRKKVDKLPISGPSGKVVKIDPNTASLEHLLLLPCIDREEAEEIIIYRETNRIDTPEEMIQIPKIEPGEYQVFRHLIEIKETLVVSGVSTGEVAVSTQEASVSQ